MNNISTFIELAYKEVINEYIRSFQHRASSSRDRSWFPKEYPHLVRDRLMLPVLYDMNVNTYTSPHNTGICLPVALFVKSYIKDVHNTDVEMVGLWDNSTEYNYTNRPIFCHCVIKYKDKYHDAFWPEGTQDENKIMFADQCVHGDVESIIKIYKTHHGCEYLKENLFDKVKKTLYKGNSFSENYILNLEPTL